MKKIDIMSFIYLNVFYENQKIFCNFSSNTLDLISFSIFDMLLKIKKKSFYLKGYSPVLELKDPPSF